MADFYFKKRGKSRISGRIACLLLSILENRTFQKEPTKHCRKPRLCSRMKSILHLFLKEKEIIGIPKKNVKNAYRITRAAIVEKVTYNKRGL